MLDEVTFPRLEVEGQPDGGGNHRELRAHNDENVLVPDRNWTLQRLFRRRKTNQEEPCKRVRHVAWAHDQHRPLFGFEDDGDGEEQENATKGASEAMNAIGMSSRRRRRATTCEHPDDDREPDHEMRRQIAQRSSLSCIHRRDWKAHDERQVLLLALVDDGRACGSRMLSMISDNERGAEPHEPCASRRR